MIGIDDRVALAFGDILFVRQFGTGDDVDAALRDDFAVEDAFIEIGGPGRRLMLPQVCRGSQVAGAVAVKGRIADGQFGFIGIAREDAAKSSCCCGQDTAGAVAGLDVFFDEARQFQLPLVLAAWLSFAWLNWLRVSSRLSWTGTTVYRQPILSASSLARLLVMSEL